MSKKLSRDGGRDVDRARRFDPERGSFDPPKHPSLGDPQVNPRGVRHIDETAQDEMAVRDRPRYQAAQGRRVAMIAAAKRRLRALSGRPTEPPHSSPPDPSSSRGQGSDMHTVQIPRHPDDIDLTWEQVRDALRALEGSRVTVRVVERSDPEMLLAVFQGNLGALSDAKHPALFWPVCLPGGKEPANTQDADIHFERDRDHVEDVGFYLRRDRFQGGVGRAGCTVLAIIQGPVLINIRRA